MKSEKDVLKKTIHELKTEKQFMMKYPAIQKGCFTFWYRGKHLETHVWLESNKGNSNDDYRRGIIKKDDEIWFGYYFFKPQRGKHNMACDQKFKGTLAECYENRSHEGWLSSTAECAEWITLPTNLKMP